MLKYIDHQDYVFDDRTIHGVRVFGIMAFENEDLWHADVTGRAIPEMGEEYMELFIKCKFNVYIFLYLAEKMGDEELKMIDEEDGN